MVSEIIVPKNTLGDQQVHFLSREQEDSGEWMSWGPFSKIAEPIFWCMMAQVDITFDPTIPTEVAAGKEQPDLQTVKIDAQWTAVVNYSKRWLEGLPPWHIGVIYRDQDVGVISPLQNVRTCWKCGASGFYVQSQDWALKTGQPAKRIPRCVPYLFCPGHPNIVKGIDLGWKKCGELDWYGYREFGVTPEDLRRAAAERAADVSEDGASDFLYDEMSDEFDGSYWG